MASSAKTRRRRWLRAIALAICLTAPAVLADSAWERVDEKAGVVLWRGVEEQAVPTARATVSVDAPLCEVLAILHEVDRFCDWMADCVESRGLTRSSPFGGEAYLRIKGESWVGVADRDVVLAIDTRVVEPHAVVEVPFLSQATNRVAEVEGVVRMPSLTGSYRLTAESATRTAIDYRFAADLGGRVPGFLAERTVTKLPLVTLAKLRALALQRRGTFAPTIAAWPPLPGGLPCAAAAPSAHGAEFGVAGGVEHRQHH